MLCQAVVYLCLFRGATLVDSGRRRTESIPRRVRWERITFLSREEYLAEITKQMERLLNRVRTLYRQQRAAHELVLGLDPEVAPASAKAPPGERPAHELVERLDIKRAAYAQAAERVMDAVDGNRTAAARVHAANARSR